MFMMLLLNSYSTRTDAAFAANRPTNDLLIIPALYLSQTVNAKVTGCWLTKLKENS